MAKGNAYSGGGKPNHKPTTSSKQKNKNVQPKGATSVPNEEPTIDEKSKVPQELQQECLNIFQDATRPHADDTATLQQVKAHLFARDFAAAFGDQAHLRVYASRWSPSRALGYLHILTDLEPHLLSAISAASEDSTPTGAPQLRVACLGGGAGSELVALGGWRKTLALTSSLELSTELIDSADWATVVAALHTRLTTPRELSRYASASARAANVPMLAPDVFRASFQHTDVLAWPDAELETALVPARLVTLMFTLNELYTTSIPRTQTLLARLTVALRPGALLLVVDSPGSYSSVQLAGAEKKYPMVWLLDLALLGAPGNAANAPPAWEKVVSDASRWFRLPAGLKYPIELENMRFQIHLYRRLGDAEEMGN
nr:25s rrna (uridine(2843)-n(3))-methyltransferase [Quercus suber]